MFVFLSNGSWWKLPVRVDVVFIVRVARSLFLRSFRCLSPLYLDVFTCQIIKSHLSLSFSILCSTHFLTLAFFKLPLINQSFMIFFCHCYLCSVVAVGWLKSINSFRFIFVILFLFFIIQMFELRKLGGQFVSNVVGSFCCFVEDWVWNWSYNRFSLLYYSYVWTCALLGSFIRIFCSVLKIFNFV